MKYTIEGFQQQTLVEMGLDCIDAGILRFIVDFYNTSRMKMIEINGVIFFWINYQTIINEMPILGITSRKVLARRFNKYIVVGLMQHHHHLNGGSYSYYRFTEKYEDLISTPVTQKSNPCYSKVPTPVTQKYQPLLLKSTNKDSNTINSSTNDSSTKDNNDDIPYQKIIDEMNKQLGTSYKSVSKEIRRLIHARWETGFRESDFIAVVKLKKEQWMINEKMRIYLRPSTLFGTKFESYLQEMNMKELDEEKTPTIEDTREYVRSLEEKGIIKRK